MDLVYRVPPGVGEGLPYRPGHEYYASPREGEWLLGYLEEHGTLLGQWGGGSAANTLVALSRLGFNCSFIGKVGVDPGGDFLLASLEKVGREGVTRQGRSGLCITLLMGEDRDRSLVICPNANDRLSFQDISPGPVCQQGRWLHLASFNGDLPLEAQARLLERLPPSVTVSLDPGMLYARRGLEGIYPLLAGTHYFFPEKKEVEMLTGRPYREGARQLLGHGPRVVLCTLGEEGLWVVSRSREFFLPALEVPVVDTTGAGDVLAAGFIASRLQGKGLEESADLGVRLAARSITGLGRERYPEAGGPGLDLDKKETDL